MKNTDKIIKGIGGSELDGLILYPILGPHGNLIFLSIRFKDAPGLELRLTGNSVRELRDGLTQILDSVQEQVNENEREKI